ncbi:MULTISPECIES: DUF2834 domain-containing protein [unclassified Bacillus (in: firmicutes)]|uniref:DUF2834 domain-containing protein n=1 Tax=unclassified Bacillus (in: firmicutes) TaxID=185979 RepID=UPI0008F27C86|nr:MULTISPECIES: DUF2834 domain-containing protein [unclassified Bacillus (in: firmicutes)]SFA87689.1 Protein of unknown function [Bacillus sp. UNCCL13]SFQ84361.1 Protein of unknown function [Bacillus sp. cl95]
MKRVYILLTVIGAILPYYFFINFIMVNGLNLKLLGDYLFANTISSFFATDFFISCIVFWLFMYNEVKKYKIKEWWICLILNLTIGLSCALPLFLYFRHAYEDRKMN